MRERGSPLDPSPSSLSAQTPRGGKEENRLSLLELCLTFHFRSLFHQARGKIENLFQKFLWF